MSVVSGSHDNLGDLECDYDRNPTNLYQLIQQKEWDGVRYTLRHFPEEVKTYVFRMDKKTHLLQWRILPIHAALLVDAPIEIIEAILKAHPKSAEAQDDHGHLPIHLAIKKHYSPSVINLLLSTYPECTNVANFDGRKPLQMAQRSSSKHKEYYLRALRKGSATNAAITSPYSDLMCGMNMPFTNLATFCSS